MPNKIFVLILNYKKHLDTSTCLDSLLSSDLPKNSQVIVLDNSPTKESYNYLSKSFPKVKIIHNKKNLGFAGGNNVGIRLALKQNATHILILNPDTIVPKHFLKPLIEHSKTSGADIIAPALEHYQNNQKFYGLEGFANKINGTAKHLNVKKIHGTKLRAAEFVTFACVLIKFSVFQKIGLLNQSYFMYLEDVDFCLTAAKSELKVYLDPSVIVKHNTSSSFKKSTDKLLISFKSQLHFISRWIKFPNSLIAYAYTILFYPYLYLLWTYHAFKHKKT